MQWFTTLINTALARWVETLFWALFSITAVVVAFFEPGTNFFHDESFVVWLDKPGWNHIKEVMPYEPFPPLYHWLMALWISLAGDSEAAVRGFSGICFLLSLGVIAWLGRFLFRRAELMAMLIAVVCSKMAQGAAVYGRMYTFGFLESCLGLLAFGAFSSGQATGWGMISLLCVANLAGMMTHYYFAYVVLAEGVVLLLFVRKEWTKAAMGIVLPVILFAVLQGPILLQQIRSSRFQGNLIEPLLWSNLWINFYDYYKKRWFLLVIPAVVFLMATALTGRRLRLRGWRELKAETTLAAGDRRLWALSTVWLIVFMGPFITAFVTGPGFFTGGGVYLLALLPLSGGLAILIRNADHRLKLALGFLVLGITMVSEIRGRTKIYKDDIARHESIQLLKDKVSDNDIVVCLDCYVTLFYYYLDRKPGAKRVDVLAYPAQLAKQPGFYNESVAVADEQAFLEATREFARQQAKILAGRPGHRLWLINTVWNRRTMRIVTSAFDRVLRLVELIPVQGGSGGFSKYLIYEADLAKMAM